MVRWMRGILFTLTATALAANPAFAQQRAGTGATGSNAALGFGSGGTGRTAFGGGGVGTNSFGAGSFGSGTGNSGFGGGGFGSGGFGGGGFGTSGFGQGAQGGFGSQPGAGGRAFVGRSARDMANVFEGVSRAQENRLQRLERAARQNRRRGEDVEGQNVAPPIRIRLKVGFDHVPPSTSTVVGQLEARLASLSSQRQIQDAEFDLSGRTVTLRGTVASAQERRVLERLVRLEPGITSVNNQLKFRPPNNTR